MTRVNRACALAITLVVTSAVLSLSGCFAASAPVPSSTADAADTASDAKTEPAFGCLDRARVIDPEEVIAYHVTSFVGLRTEGAPELGMSLSGRYVIGFEEGTFRVEPAMGFDMSGAGQAVSTRQTGVLTGRYSIEGAVAHCRGDDLVLKLSKAGGGLHTGVNLPAD